MTPHPDLSVVIAAGGTGGHIYPGLAVADALAKLAPDAQVSFLGTPRGLEGRLVPGAGYPLDLVDMVPFAGRGRVLVPFALVRSSIQTRRVLATRRASVALGMGGYASIPLVMAARLSRVPSLIHESGAVPGRANRLAARVTRHVALAWDQAASAFPGAVEPRVVGMPLNPEIAGFDRRALRREARAALDVPDGAALLLVTGGSQGAATLNRLAIGLAGRWRDRHDVRIVVKAGRTHAEQVRADLERSGGEAVARCVTYFERMDHAYAAADLAVCRAGAGTVAELAATGLPAVLVPYPFAPDDHQTANARVLTEVGAGVLVPDAEAVPDRLAPLIERWLDDPGELERMGRAAGTVARPHAAEELAGWALELAGSR